MKMARTFGRGMRQIRDASHQIQEDIKNAVVDDIPRSNLKKEINKTHTRHICAPNTF